MAKARATRKVKTEVPEPTAEPLAPERVHELFGVPGPYEPPVRPLGLAGFIPFWDPGVSIRSLAKAHRGLFCQKEFPQKFAADSDSWRWKLIRLAAGEPGQTFAEQRQALKLGEPPAAREVVVFLLLHFLATGVRLEVGRVRCKDVTESGRRVFVGPFHALGLDIGNVSDEWKSPGIGLAELCLPRRN